MKERTAFHCQSCGYRSVRWLGRCPDCGEWNSLVEEPERPSGKGQNRAGTVRSSGPSLLPLAQVSGKEEERFSTRIGELDRVLGGGIVPGSVVLIGGDPGIGKSTLMLQMAQQLASQGKGVLYVSGEESPQQVKMRAGRLGSIAEGIYILPETRVESVLGYIDDYIKSRENHPLEVVIVDSIQTLFTEEIGSAPGSVSQIREAASLLMGFAKSSQTAVFMAGHVTKDGAIAGPRVLEHIVDTVLYFEGDRGHPFRILRAVKNRFGSTHEIGVFEMEGSGLRQVSNPSALFLSERPQHAAGSVVVSALEGSRPIFTELQALVCPSGLGIPRRTSIGVDYNRVLLLLSILEKRVGLHLHGQDVFINVAGGIEISEPAIDLGVIAAVASSFREIPIDPSTFVQGEVGLAGEIRAVASVETRLREASKLGFKRCVLPVRSRVPPIKGIEILAVSTVREALEVLLEK